MPTSKAVNVIYPTAGNVRLNIVDVALPDPYLTGGVPVTPAEMGLNRIYMIVAAMSGGRSFEWDAANAKLIAYDAAGTQTPNATDLHATTVRLLAIGI